MKIEIIKSYISSKWHQHNINKPQNIKQHQDKIWHNLQKQVIAKSPFYQTSQGKPLSQLTIINKKIMMESFDQINICGLTN